MTITFITLVRQSKRLSDERISSITTSNYSITQIYVIMVLKQEQNLMEAV